MLGNSSYEEKITLVHLRVLLKTYNVDESRKKDDDDGEDAHQGAVQSGLDYPLRKSLQRDWEQLGVSGGGGQGWKVRN